MSPLASRGLLLGLNIFALKFDHWEQSGLVLEAAGPVSLAFELIRTDEAESTQHSAL